MPYRVPYNSNWAGPLPYSGPMFPPNAGGYTPSPIRPADVAPFDWAQFLSPGLGQGPIRPPDVPTFDWSQFSQPAVDSAASAFPGTEFTPGTYTPGTAPVYADPTAQVNKIYDPQIAAIQSLMTSTQHRGDVNSANIKNMYAALANTAGQDAAATNNQYAHSQAATQADYNQAGSAVGSQYDASQAAQLLMMKKLGITAAAPGALAQQSADKNFVQGLLKSGAANAKSALEQNKQTSASVLNTLHTAAPLAGNQKQIDLMAQVQDRIDQLNANKMTLNSDRASKITDLTNQAASGLAQFNQQENANRNAFNQQQAAGQQQALDNQFKWANEMRSQADQNLQTTAAQEASRAAQQQFGINAAKAANPAASNPASTDVWNNLLTSASTQVANPQDYVGYILQLITSNNDIRHGSQGGFNMTPEQFAAIAVQNAPGGLQQGVLVDLAQKYWSSLHGK